MVDDERVHPAELRRDAGQPLDLGLLADVGVHVRRVELAPQRLAAGVVDVAQHEPRALRREQPGGGVADVAGRAGQHDDPAVQPHAGSSANRRAAAAPMADPAGVVLDLGPAQALELEPEVEHRRRRGVQDALGPERRDGALDPVLAVDAAGQRVQVRRALQRQVGRLLGQAGHVQLPAARHHDRDVEAAGQVGDRQRLGQERPARLHHQRPAGRRDPLRHAPARAAWLARMVSSHGCTSRPRTAGWASRRSTWASASGCHGSTRTRQTARPPLAAHASARRSLAPARSWSTGRAGAATSRSTPFAAASASRASRAAPLPSKCRPA